MDKQEIIALANEFYTKLLNLKNDFNRIKQLKVLYNIYINNIASIELELMAELKSLTKPLKLESLIESVKDD